MIDPNLLRYQIDIVAQKLLSRNVNIDINKVRSQEQYRKFLQVKYENLQAEKNAYSKNVGIIKSQGKKIEINYLKIIDINKQLNYIKKKLFLLQKDINNYLSLLPNIPSDDIPIGNNYSSNVEILRYGTLRNYNFPIRDHIEIGKILGGLDFSIATQVTGARFVVMRNQVAKLHRAIIQFMLDVHTEQHGYVEYYVPYLVNNHSLYGTGQLPKFSEDLFCIQNIQKNNQNQKYNNIFALIPTAEVPLINLLKNNIFEENDLPIKMTAHSPCFRREAGSYGHDTRGLIRMHQFEKIEIVQAVKPDLSMVVLETITNHAEKILQLLNLPYRKMLLCTGEISFSSCKTYDLEVWLPSQNDYLEISSCSNTGDFQSRRIQARYRCKNEKKNKLLHILNGSGLAVSRTLIAILENYQLANGNIEIPLVLQPYMKGLTLIS